MLLGSDHFVVGPGDRVDGLRLPAVALQQLIPLRNQSLHTGLAISLGLLFKRCDQALDAGARLIRNSDHLQIGGLGLLLEAFERGVGLADRVEHRLLLGFEDYSFRLIGHFTLP